MALAFGLCCMLFGVLVAASPVAFIGASRARDEPDKRMSTAMAFGAANALAVGLGMAAVGWFTGSDMPAARAGTAKIIMAASGFGLGSLLTFALTAGVIVLTSRRIAR